VESIQSFRWPIHSVQKTPQIFGAVRRGLTTRHITLTSLSRRQPITTRLLSHVTLGLVERRKYTACAQIAERYETNIVGIPRNTAIYCRLWSRGTAVERRSLAGELSLSRARPVADGRPLMWVNHPLWVNQPGQLDQPFLRSGSINA